MLAGEEINLHHEVHDDARATLFWRWDGKTGSKWPAAASHKSLLEH